MAVSYEKILRSVALRTNAFTTGTTPPVLQTAYITSPLTSTQVASPDFPFTAYLDTILIVEEKIATAVASFAIKEDGMMRYHPWRRSILSQTASIANNALVPS